MNHVALIGRLTRDPEVRYSGDMAICRFSIAIDRPPRRDGTKETDFPSIVVFGKQAENCEKYISKGRLVGIEGRIQTGKYQNRNGDTVYTTEVIANRVEFLDWGDRGGRAQQGGQGMGTQWQQAQQSSPQSQQPSYQDPGSGQPAGGSSPAPAASQNPASEPFGNPQEEQPSPNGIPRGFEEIDDDDIPF